MSQVYFVTDVETTGPDFAYHNMYQFAAVPVLPDGTVLKGLVLDVDFDPARGHDQDTLDFLRRDLQITPETLKARTTMVKPDPAMRTFNSFITANSGGPSFGVESSNILHPAEQYIDIAHLVCYCYL